MNKIIIEQLKKCTVARIPPFDENTTHMEIPQVTAKGDTSCIPGHYYIIELDDYLLKSCTIHINWNKNIIPLSKHYKCECIQIMGSMVKINGIAFNIELETDLDSTWEGWLPLNNIKILKEI